MLFLCAVRNEFCMFTALLWMQLIFPEEVCYANLREAQSPVAGGLWSPPPHPPLFIPFVILQKLTWVLSSSWLPSPGFAFSYQSKAANRRKTFPHRTVSSAAFRHNGHPLPIFGSTFLRVLGAIRIDCRQSAWMGNSLVLWACICPKRVYVQSRPFSFVCSPCCILLEWGWLHWSH